MPRITGADGVALRLSGAIGQKVVREVGAALFAGGEEIRGEASHLITEGSVSGAGHIASLPGEPPNADTRTLNTHIETTQPAPLRVEVSSNALSEKGYPYNVALEFGSSKMSERPYMRPATQRKRKAVVDLVRQAVNRATKA